MGNSWYIICVLLPFIRGFPVAQRSKVVGVKGEYVILNCSYIGNNSERNSVHWRDGNGKRVYDIINGSGNASSEHQGRATSFPEKYQNGNYSIKLGPLRETDERLYQCLITDNSKQHSEITELSVKEKPEDRHHIEAKGISLANELYVLVLFLTVAFCF